VSVTAAGVCDPSSCLLRVATSFFGILHSFRALLIGDG